MTWRFSPKFSRHVIYILALFIFLGGSFSFWYYKTQIKKSASATNLNDTAQVKATVLPQNPNIGYTTISIGTGNTPTVVVENITIDNKPTNLPITCTITYTTPSGQNVTINQIVQNLGECNYNPALPPQNQNATVEDGSISDITASSGVGTVQVSLRLANTTVKSPIYNYKSQNLAGPSFNLQNFQPPTDLRSNQTDSTDLIAKINIYTGVIVLTAMVVTGYLVIFFNIINSFRVRRFRDFTEELNIALDIFPKEICLNEPMRLVSTVLDESDKAVNNLECILTLVTPAKECIKIKVMTNQEGKCGVYITKDGKIDNQTALEKENLHPANLERGDLRGFNSIDGHGIAYVKAKVYSNRYHSRQITWTVKKRD